MARARPLSEIVDEAYRLADAVRNDLRHPRPDVIRWVNKGLAELWDMLLERNGRDWSHSSATIPLTGATEYPLPATFYKLIAIRKTPDGGNLIPFAPAQEAELRDSSTTTGAPLFYQLRANELVVLPVGSYGEIHLDFIANFVDLALETDTFDGIAGFEDYGALFAAKRMAMRDESPELMAMLDAEMGRLAGRVRAMTAVRDVGEPKRVKDVRGSRSHARRRWWAS